MMKYLFTLPAHVVMVLTVPGILAACSPPNHTDNPRIEEKTAVTFIPATDDRIAQIGRTHIDDNNIRFAYPGVTLLFTTTASRILLKARSTSEQSYLEIKVDNQPAQIVKVPGEDKGIPLSLGMAGEQHQVRIMHRGETWHGIITVTGLELADGELLPAPVLPSRKILVLGDSVTCGEAIERQPDCQKNTSWWNAAESYGILLGKALNAQVHLVCYGGRGLVRSWNGRTDELNLPDYFELAIADAKTPTEWDHRRYTPDLILSAIGTNDFSEGIPDEAHYVHSYLQLIQRLVSLYPEAEIALTDGAILNGDKKMALEKYLHRIARGTSGPVHIIPSNHYPGDACDAHPTKAQHAAMADDLAPLLGQLMNW